MIAKPSTLSQKQVLDRGWTVGLIKKFKPERIDSETYRSLYSLADIERIEATEDFKEALIYLDKSRRTRRLRKQANELARIKEWVIDWLPLQLELEIFYSEVINRSFVSTLITTEEYRLYGSKLVVDRVFNEFSQRVPVKPELEADALEYLHNKLGYVCSSLHKQVLRENLRKV